MKKIFTLCLLTFSVMLSRAQAILNEIYVQPGNGYNEFFELYNTGYTSENLDDYTIVTYYEEPGGKSGFYVMDLPNLSVAPKGYFVGASANPFNIQQQSNLTADFNWNAMPPGGSLTKWEKNGAGYTQVAVPANLNDFFVKTGGSGAVYHVFVYKDGKLVNGFIGGINANIIPSYIRSMPPLFVNMTGSAPDFTIDWTAIPDNSVEYTSMAVGTNNGYYRAYDGKCGAWLKSDQPGQHTPGVTNGSATNIFGDIKISATISVYAPDPSKSLLTYDIKSGPAYDFPLTVEVYHDNDSVGLLGSNDSLIDSRLIMDASAGSQFVILPDSNYSVIIALKSPAGCYDLVLSMERYNATLPVKLFNFRGNLNNNNRATLNWSIANNETIRQFEVERSKNGRDFSTASVVLSSETSGAAEYMYSETVYSFSKIYYRLKIIDNNSNVSYSEMLVFQAKDISNNQIKIMGNPVKDKLVFNYSADKSEISDFKVYDLSGKIIVDKKLYVAEGINTFSIPINEAIKPGLYIIQISDGNERQTGKFVKQ